MLLIDKYKCKNDYDLLYNEDIIKQLKNISKYKNIPNIILYGNEGAGKKTLVNLFLKYVYNDDIYNLNINEYEIVNGSNNKQISYKYSPYHIILNFVKNNSYDKYIIQKLIKMYAKNYMLSDNKIDKPFKFVFIQNIENLSYYAQMSLRRTIEQNSQICKFIFTCNAINNIIEPLKSRCINIRVPNPSNNELKLVLNDIYYKETNQINTRLIDYIIKYSNHNIKNAILILNQCLINYNINIKSGYDNIINKIIKNILNKDLSSILASKENIYNILITNIEPSKIFIDIMKKLLENNELNDKQKEEIINLTKIYNIRCMNCRRVIMEIINYINSIIIFLLEY